MNANTPAIVQMTGPHTARVKRKGRAQPIWQVAIVAAADQKAEDALQAWGIAAQDVASWRDAGIIR